MSHIDKKNPHKFPKIRPQTDSEKLLMEFVIDMKKNRKVNNPHLIVSNICKWVKPIQTKCLELICNLISQSLDNINQYEDREKFDKFITKQLQPDNWYEIENTVDFKKIISTIVNSDRSIDLLNLYQEILEENNVVIDLNTYAYATNSFNKIRKENQETLITLELIVSEKDQLKIANRVYKEAFNSNLVHQELSASISNLVTNNWQSSFDLEVEKQKVVPNILKYLPQLAKKTDNLARIIKQILQYSKFQPLLVESLLKLACQEDNLILLGKKGDANFKRLIERHLIKNWQTKISSEEKSEIFEHYKLIQEELIYNKNCDPFWLLIIYRDILRGKEILFHKSQEEKKLFHLKLVEQHPENSHKLRIVNHIYESVFDEKWVSDKLQEIQYPNYYKNLLAWLDRDNFQSHVTTLKEKFPDNLKEVMTETIRWTYNDLNITEKIVNFIKFNDFEVTSENITEWFYNNIILSPSLGTEQEQEKNYLWKEDFEILIGNIVNNLDIKADKHQITTILLPLTDKFKQNPLIIIEKLLSLTKNEPNHTLIKNLVDLILQDSCIIRTETDVDKISNFCLRQQIKTQDNNTVEELNMQSSSQPNQRQRFDDLLNDLVKKEDGIEAIVIFNISRKLAQYHNSNLNDTNPKLFNILFRNRGVSRALKNFHLLENIPKAINTFGEETNTGKLDYTIFCLNEGVMIAYMTPFEGQSFAICYITTDSSLLASIIFSAEVTIKKVKERLTEEFKKYQDN